MSIRAILCVFLILGFGFLNADVTHTWKNTLRSQYKYEVLSCILPDKDSCVAIGHSANEKSSDKPGELWIKRIDSSGKILLNKVIKTNIGISAFSKNQHKVKSAFLHSTGNIEMFVEFEDRRPYLYSFNLKSDDFEEKRLALNEKPFYLNIKRVIFHDQKYFAVGIFKKQIVIAKIGADANIDAVNVVEVENLIGINDVVESDQKHILIAFQSGKIDKFNRGKSKISIKKVAYGDLEVSSFDNFRGRNARLLSDTSGGILVSYDQESSSTSQHFALRSYLYSEKPNLSWEAPIFDNNFGISPCYLYENNEGGVEVMSVKNFLVHHFHISSKGNIISEKFILHEGVVELKSVVKTGVGDYVINVTNASTYKENGLLKAKALNNILKVKF
jgi:hypothetical protein